MLWAGIIFMFFHFLISFRTCLFGDCFNKFAQRGELVAGLVYLTGDRPLFSLVFGVPFQGTVTLLKDQISASGNLSLLWRCHSLLTRGQDSAPTQSSSRAHSCGDLKGFLSLDDIFLFVFSSRLWRQSPWTWSLVQSQCLTQLL